MEAKKKFSKNNFNELYSSMTKKIKELNNNKENKWQLHITDGLLDNDSFEPTKSLYSFLCLMKFPIPQEYPGINFKPNGLWTSMPYKSNTRNYFWTNFLKEKHINWGNPGKKYTKFFIFKFDNTRIFQINSQESFIDFQEHYLTSEGLIDWTSVANDHFGINITPFRKEFKDIYWYKNWDVASQCVWNKECIIDIKELKIINKRIEFTNWDVALRQKCEWYKTLISSK